MKHNLTKLANKRKKKKKNNALLAGAAGGIGVAGATHLGKGLIGRATNKIYGASNKGDPYKALDLMDKIDKDKFDVVHGGNIDSFLDSPDQPLKKEEFDSLFRVKRGKDGKPKTTSGGAYLDYKDYGAKSKKRGIIYSPLNDDMSPTTILHELGHGTGKGSRSKFLRNALYRTSRIKKPIALGGAAVSGGMAASAQTKEEIDRARKMNNLSLGSGMLLHAPLLIEEGRANIRAVGLGKKLGVPANKKQLAAAMGTYLGSAGAMTALPWYINRKILQAKERKLKKKG